jgi:hypothetical protein
MACNFPNELTWVVTGLQMNVVADAPCWFTKHSTANAAMNPVRA